MSTLVLLAVLFPLLCLTTTVLCDYNLNVIISNFTSFSLNCNRGEDVGLYTSILLQYRLVSPPLTGISPQNWTTISVLPSNQHSQVVEESVNLEDSVEGFQLRLVQLEHGGGTCNCWTHSDLDVTVNNFEIVLDYCLRTVDEETGLFCSPSVEEGRGEITIAHYFAIEPVTSYECPGDSGEILVTDEGSPLPDFTYCKITTPRIELLWQLLIDVDETGGCSSLQGSNETVEFAMRDVTHDGPWVPLSRTCYLCDSDNMGMDKRPFRGHNIPTFGANKTEVNHFVYICGDFLEDVEEVQFRWKGVATPGDLALHSVWAVSYVVAEYYNLGADNETFTVLFEDLFNSTELNTSVWLEPIRGGTVNCTDACLNTLPCMEHYLTFNAYNNSLDSVSIARSQVFALPQLSFLQEIEISIQDEISRSERLSAIRDAEPEEALDELLLETMSFHSDAAVDSGNITVVLYLLGDILNRYNATEDQQQFLETFLDVSVYLTGGPDATEGEIDVEVVGATFLNVLDRYALEVFPTTGDISTENGNIVLLAQELTVGEEDAPIFIINSEDFTEASSTRMSIQIPPEVVRDFESEIVRAVSFIYRDVDRLFPGNLPGENDTELGSGIVSTALRCGAERCPTDLLKTPVTITIQHSEQEEREATCVFWEFLNESSENNILSVGQWSDRGCSKNKALSNVSTTVCECYHLTHFAILLSAAPINASRRVIASLEIIGYVGVTISLVAMAITVFAFLFLRSLRNTRNFIHINLCVSLGIAQIIFVAAVDRASGSDDDVPAHCQAVAVLLHYFFLVTFMWMLMEGVILYIALVTVFVKRKKRHLFALILTSYGVPLLYLGALTLPLGFALDKRPNYGYASACYLNPENGFIWAFIAPVLVIFLVNCGFFVMAATIIWRHQKQQSDQTRLQNLKAWLRSALSLVVIMGLTWILGVLIVEVEELLPLAYIYTIMVAFQGLWIFIIFVVLSRQVQEAYKKWWRAKVNGSETLQKYFGSSSISAGGATIYPHTNHHERHLNHDQPPEGGPGSLTLEPLPQRPDSDASANTSMPGSLNSSEHVLITEYQQAEL